MAFPFFGIETFSTWLSEKNPKPSRGHGQRSEVIFGVIFAVTNLGFQRGEGGFRVSELPEDF